MIDIMVFTNKYFEIIHLLLWDKFSLRRLFFLFFIVFISEYRNYLGENVSWEKRNKFAYN